MPTRPAGVSSVSAADIRADFDALMEEQARTENRMTTRVDSPPGRTVTRVDATGNKTDNSA